MMSECLHRNSHLPVFFLLLISLTRVYTSSPLVLDGASSCSYKIGKRYLFTNNMQSTSKENVTVYFNLCDQLPSKICGDNVMACVKHKNGTVLLRGSNLDFGSPEDKQIFNLITENELNKISTALHIEIKDRCSHLELEMEIEHTSSAFIVYHVYMNDPGCSSPNDPCIIKVEEKHIDLRLLKGTYSVQSPLKNFSISLCEPNRLCRSTDVTACIIESNKTEPISEVYQENLDYQERENQVVLKGKYNKNGIKNLFELRLQCNWDMATPKISYIVPQSQGKKYRFLMESSQACILKNPQCEFPSSRSTYYYYNLSRLNNVDGYIVKNMSAGSQMYINPCGRLKFRGSKNFCTDTYSQICETRNGQYFNNGSMFKNCDVGPADLSITYASGITCKDADTKQYQTHISFRCSNLSENPIVVKNDKCDLYIKWNTPEACLKAKKHDCDEIPASPSLNCTVEQDGDIYDLSKLAKENSSYVLKDKDDPSIEYLLNVCTSVVDDEAACIKGASVILKNSSELDITKRVKSLGKLNSLSIVNENLVIETTDGQCDTGEYSSKIIFICSDKEETPILTKKTKCNFEFVFKTKYACANQPVSAEAAKCRFKYPSTVYQIDFKNYEPSMLEVVQTNTSYYFNICKTEPQAECNGECVYVQPKKVLFVHEGKAYLDFQLNRSCQSSDEFNRTLIELRCESVIKNNDHFEKTNIANCILYLLLVTSKACLNNENTDGQSEARDIEQTKYSVGDIDISRNLTEYQTKKIEVEVNTKSPGKNSDVSKKNQLCTNFIKNNYTGYTFNISSLKLQVEVIGCPSIALNYSNNSVSIVYPTHIPCLNVRSTVSKYNVVLKCVPDGHHKIVQNDCENMIVNEPKACKLLEKVPLSAAYSKAAVAGITIAVLVLLTAIAAVSVLAYVKVFRKRILYGTIAYEKDAEL